VDRRQGQEPVLDWVRSVTSDRHAIAAVDAPTIITNATGIRECERQLNADFRRFDAGCHAANLGLPFAGKVLAFSRALRELGFEHAFGAPRLAPGRFQMEVHPHAASVSLFGLPRIIKYKRGLRAGRHRELSRLRRLLTGKLPLLDPPLDPAGLPSIPRSGDLKPAEDRLDAVLCAYIAAHWWFWGRVRNRVYGSEAGGFIVVPDPQKHPD
jgi:predicted RNase H-like nuclease